MRQSGFYWVKPNNKPSARWQILHFDHNGWDLSELDGHWSPEKIPGTNQPESFIVHETRILNPDEK